MYLTHPPALTFKINQSSYDLKNPYDELKRLKPNIFTAGRQEGFTYQILQQPSSF